MKIPEVFTLAYQQVRPPVKLVCLLAIGFVMSAIFPSDLASYPAPSPSADVPKFVAYSEDYLRFVPTVVQVALPLLLRDKIGMVQLFYVAVSTTVATHGFKRILNDSYVSDTRLGQRPSRSGSKHNMPSGHSSMASCAVYFVGRRYGIWLALALVPFLLLAMYARFCLNAHTVSAVIAGALIGLLTAAFFTSKGDNGIFNALRLRRLTGQVLREPPKH